MRFILFILIFFVRCGFVINWLEKVGFKKTDEVKLLMSALNKTEKALIKIHFINGIESQIETNSNAECIEDLITEVQNAQIKIAVLNKIKSPQFLKKIKNQLSNQIVFDNNHLVIKEYIRYKIILKFLKKYISIIKKLIQVQEKREKEHPIPAFYLFKKKSKTIQEFQKNMHKIFTKHFKIVKFYKTQLNQLDSILKEIEFACFFKNDDLYQITFNEILAKRKELKLIFRKEDLEQILNKKIQFLVEAIYFANNYGKNFPIVFNEIKKNSKKSLEEVSNKVIVENILKKIIRVIKNTTMKDNFSIVLCLRKAQETQLQVIKKILTEVEVLQEKPQTSEPFLGEKFE